MSFKVAHLVIGMLGFILFVLQGQYMALSLGGLLEMPDGERMLYRSAHLYLMFCSALNLAFGMREDPFAGSFISGLTSAVLLVSPAFMLIEFFFGAQSVEQQRHFIYWGCVAVFTVLSFSCLRFLIRKSAN